MKITSQTELQDLEQLSPFRGLRLGGNRIHTCGVFFFLQLQEMRNGQHSNLGARTNRAIGLSRNAA